MTAYLQLVMGLPCLTVEYVIILGQFPLRFLSTKHFGVYDIYQIWKFMRSFKKYN